MSKRRCPEACSVFFTATRFECGEAALFVPWQLDVSRLGGGIWIGWPAPGSKSKKAGERSGKSKRTASFLWVQKTTLGTTGFLLLLFFFFSFSSFFFWFFCAVVSLVVTLPLFPALVLNSRKKWATFRKTQNESQWIVSQRILSTYNTWIQISRLQKIYHSQ